MSAEIFSVIGTRNKYKADGQMFHAALTSIQSMLALILLNTMLFPLSTFNSNENHSTPSFTVNRLQR